MTKKIDTTRKISMSFVEYILSYIHNDKAFAEIDNEFLKSILRKPGPDFETMRNARLKIQR